MTNNEIIISAVIDCGIYTKAQVEKYLENGQMPPVHTYKMWQDLGYQVRKGEKAALKIRLWKMGKVSTKLENSETGDEKEVVNSKMFLANAALFTAAQVEKIETEEISTEDQEEPEEVSAEPENKTYITAQGNIIAQTRTVNIWDKEETPEKKKPIDALTGKEIQLVKPGTIAEKERQEKKSAQENLSENAKIIKEKTGCTVTNDFAETYAKSIHKQTGKTLTQYYAMA